MTDPDRRAEVAAPYTRYARFYDRQGQSQWSSALIRFTLDTLLPRYGRQPRVALDLACGTGTAALLLAQAGLAVTGLDASSAMLALARDKARQAGVPITFVEGDLRTFGLRSQFDLITCCYDSLNYLLEPADVVRAFGAMRGALAPAGLIVCDLNTAQAYARQAGALPWRLTLDEVVYDFTTVWNPQSRRATIAVRCALRGEGQAVAGSAPFVERHEQRAYERDEVLTALTAGGLRTLETFAAVPLRGPTLRAPGPNAARIVYVAERDRTSG